CVQIPEANASTPSMTHLSPTNPRSAGFRMTRDRLHRSIHRTQADLRDRDRHGVVAHCEALHLVVHPRGQEQDRQSATQTVSPIKLGAVWRTAPHSALRSFATNIAADTAAEQRSHPHVLGRETSRRNQ